MDKIVSYLKTETVVIQGLLQVGLTLGATYGLHMTAQQSVLWLAASGLALALLTRQTVSPVAGK